MIRKTGMILAFALMVMPIQGFGFDVGVGPTGVVENEAEELDEKVKNRGLAENYGSFFSSVEWTINLGTRSEGDHIAQGVIDRDLERGYLGVETDKEYVGGSGNEKPVTIYAVSYKGNIVEKKEINFTYLDDMRLTNSGQLIISVHGPESKLIAFNSSLEKQWESSAWGDELTVDSKNNLYSRASGSIYKIDSSDGDTLWVNNSSYMDLSFTPVTTDRLILDKNDNLYFLNAKYVVKTFGGDAEVKVELQSLNPTGDTRFVRKIRGRSVDASKTDEFGFMPTHFIKDSTIYAHYYEGFKGPVDESDTFFKYDLNGNSLLKKNSTNPARLAYLFFDDRKNLYALRNRSGIASIDAVNGRVNWFEKLSENRIRPSFIGSDGLIYFGTEESDEGNIFALNRSSRDVTTVFEGGPYSISDSAPGIFTSVTWAKSNEIIVRHDLNRISKVRVSTSSTLSELNSY